MTLKDGNKLKKKNTKLSKKNKTLAVTNNDTNKKAKKKVDNWKIIIKKKKRKVKICT